jgi:hypothetical protein
MRGRLLARFMNCIYCGADIGTNQYRCPYCCEEQE